jgi:hypothetical protein
VSRLNPAGVRFVHERTEPLAVDSMADAEAVLLKELEKGRDQELDRGAWARHLAWIIGFDRLLEDRKAIHQVTSLVVEPSA